VFCGTRSFIMVFRRAKICSLSWARYIQSTLSSTISLRCISYYPPVYVGYRSSKRPSFFLFLHQTLSYISVLSLTYHIPDHFILCYLVFVISIIIISSSSSKSATVQASFWFVLSYCGLSISPLVDLHSFFQPESAVSELFCLVVVSPSLLLST
jgi:hypothetical protein